MAQNEKNQTAQNAEKRHNARLDDHRKISVKDLKAGIFHKATMLNYSKNGMYFETDSIMEPGTEIYLGVEDTSDVAFADEYECRRAEIMWRKKLKKSFFNYGYGIKFCSEDNKKEQKSADHNDKIASQSERTDSRKQPRRPYSKSVIYAVNSQILEGTTQNISPSGIFIKANKKFKVGETVILSLPSKTKQRLKIKGEIAWSSEEGFGVKFIKNLT